jgi:hypothetical protein
LVETDVVVEPVLTDELVSVVVESEVVLTEVVLTVVVLTEVVDRELVLLSVVDETQVVMLQVVSHWCSWAPPGAKVVRQNSYWNPTSSRQVSQQSGSIGHEVAVVSEVVERVVVKEVLVRVVVVLDTEDVSEDELCVDVDWQTGCSTELSKHHLSSM